MSLTPLQGGEAVPAAAVQLANGGRMVVLDYPELPNGTYRILLIPNEIRDKVGNALGGDPIATTFTKATSGAV